MMNNILTAFIAMVLLLGNSALAQKVTLSGTVKDDDSGEAMIGAKVAIPALQTGAITNDYGFFSISVEPGDYEIQVSYLGFLTHLDTVKLSENFRLNIELKEEGITAEAVEITAEIEDENVNGINMSAEKLSIQTIKSIPAVFGEVDVIKAIQMLPGVQTVGEGQSGFYVRGGAVDQNLILLDEAPVYNASHLLSLFSVFNPDALKDVQIYKGGIPARYGGRLASVLDIRMKEGNNKRFSGTGGIGTIASRLTLEAPIVKNKGSFMVSGRRTYADMFLKLAKDTTLRNNRLFFYDLNAKANYEISDKDRVYLSGYSGRDVLSFDNFNTRWGNVTGTARWNHLFSPKLFSNVTLIYSKFDYFLGQDEGIDAFSWKSDIQNMSAKVDFNLFANPKHTLKFGAQTTLHAFNPGTVKGEGSDNIFNEFRLPEAKALESAVYLSNEHKVSTRIAAEYGLRLSVFQNLGPATSYIYDDQFAVTDSTVHESGIYNTYGNLEPRLGIRYMLDDHSSMKLSYNRTAQYVHLATNSTAASPLDIYFPSSRNVKPQRADQLAIGYFRNFKDNAYEGSVELYYKKMDNAIDFRDHATLLLNRFLEGELRFGKARAYGAEFMLKRRVGKFTGWLSYTLARVERQIDSINAGNWYPAKYDKTHDFSAVLSYDVHPRLSIAANWVFGTGSAVTMPTGRYQYHGVIVPVYSERNGARMPAYHRGDIGLTYKSKPNPEKRFHWDLNFSVYNVYNRHNPYSINFKQEENTANGTYAEKTYLFPILPALTWNFKF